MTEGQSNNNGMKHQHRKTNNIPRSKTVLFRCSQQTSIYGSSTYNKAKDTLACCLTELRTYLHSCFVTPLFEIRRTKPYESPLFLQHFREVSWWSWYPVEASNTILYHVVVSYHGASVFPTTGYCTIHFKKIYIYR